MNDFVSSGSIGIFPSNESMKGIFFFLKTLDGNIESRYKIDAKLQYGSISYICNYFSTTNNNYFYTTSAETDVKIKFNSTFILTDYSFSNASPDHTYPSAWQVQSTFKNSNAVIDRRSDEKFCSSENACSLCSNSIVKTYHVKKYRKSDQITFKHIKNSCNADYFILRSIELYGVLCNNSNNCVLPFTDVTCRIKRDPSFNHILAIICFLCS